MRNLRTLLLAGVFAGSAANADAAYIDLTSSGASGVINGAMFIQGATLSGTGIFPAFVQIRSNNSVEEAYNTKHNNVLDNGSSNTFNHEIRLSDVPTIGISGTNYYSFLLDINEANGSGGQGTDADKYLSLDELTVLTSTTANQSSTPLPTGVTRYNMNPGPGNGVLLNFDLEPGSGRADMKLLIPVSNFAGALQTDFVYLYSKFGVLGTLAAGNPYGAPAGNYGASDGFEEWALGTIGIPEPTSITLLGTGLLVLLGMTRRRGRRRRDFPQVADRTGHSAA